MLSNTTFSFIKKKKDYRVHSIQLILSAVPYAIPYFQIVRNNRIRKSLIPESESFIVLQLDQEQ